MEVLENSPEEPTQQCYPFHKLLTSISQDVVRYFRQKNKKIYKIKVNTVQAYSYIFQMCTSKPAYNQKMVQFFKQILLQHIHRNSRIQEQASVLQQYNILWESYITFMLGINRRVFAYLVARLLIAQDRYYMPATDEDSLSRAGLYLFRKTIFTPEQQGVLFNHYTNRLLQIRANKVIPNNQLLKFSESIAIIDNTTLFPQLRNLYIEETKKAYQQYFLSHRQLPPIQYYSAVLNLKYFQQMLMKLCICYNCYQQEQIIACFQEQIIKPYTDIFLEHKQGLIHALETKNIAFLKMICTVYKRFQGFDKVKNKYYKYVVERGSHRIQRLKTTQQGEQACIRQLYEMLQDEELLIGAGFSKHEDMASTSNNAIEHIFNKYQNLPEMLFSFTRKTLDGGHFESSRYLITKIFDKLSSKDQFLHLYRRSLEKKILSNDFIFIIEKTFIDQLNSICGSELTHHLDKKIYDYVQSAIPIDVLRQVSPRFAFNIKVMSLQLWEKQFQDQITLNPSLVQPLTAIWNRISAQYTILQPKRKLMLLPFQNKLILSIRFSRREIDIKCNIVQACIIIYLSGCSRALEDIMKHLTIEKDLLNNFIEIAPELIVINSQGMYEFNWNFDSEKFMVDIDLNVQEEKKISKAVNQDREILIEAAIVKFMKKKKEAMFQEIVVEIFTKIKLFKPLPSKIKAVVEKLIRKDFLEEDERPMILYKE